MLWDVRLEWPSGTQFTLRCYHHWYTLVVRNVDGSSHLLYRKEGVTQGGPLAMIAYGICTLLLICELRNADPIAMQPWYTYDTGAGGGVVDITILNNKIDH